MTASLAAIQLPDDMRWVDEFTWLPTVSHVELASNGALWVEESAQLAGRPITLESGSDGNGRPWALVRRATVEALRALAAAPAPAPLDLEVPDGRTFSVRFRHQDGPAVEARPLRHIVPHVADDLYHLTLRLMQV